MTTSIIKVSGVGLHTADILAKYGYKCAEDLASTDEDTLGKIPGFGSARAKLVIAAARVLCPARSEDPDSSSVPCDENGVGKKGKSKKKNKKKSKKKKENKAKKKDKQEKVKKSDSKKKRKDKK